MVLENARPLHAMPEGCADTIGWTAVQVTPDMVGRTVAVFTALEVKDQGRLTPEQRNFLRAVADAGGIAACVHSVEEARAAIDQGPNTRGPAL